MRHSSTSKGHQKSKSVSLPLPSPGHKPGSFLYAKTTGSSISSPTFPSKVSGSIPNLVKQRRRANLLRVRIERGLMVGMGLLAGYRMMTLDYSAIKGVLSSQRGGGYRRPLDAMPTLAKSAWSLGAGFVLLTVVHALFLTAHDHRLQFPLHNKNLPLQPLPKRSRYLNTNAVQAVVAAESEDESEDDETLQRALAAEIQENMANENNAPGVTCLLSGLQRRFGRSSDAGSVPQWRVWGSEAHWYRKGADNGSIFASVLVPVVLAAKFVQTVTDEKFSSTGLAGIKTAESVLSNMALSLTFGASILIHMLLLKLFEDPSGPLSKAGLSNNYNTRSTILDSIVLPPAMMTSSTPSTSMSTNNLSTSSSHPRHPSLRAHQSAISSPSSPSSPSLSAQSTPVSVFQQRQQQELQQAFMFSSDQMHHPSVLLGTSESEKTSDREEIWIIALGFGGAYTCLITLLARFKWIPGLENTGAGMVMLNQNIFQILMIGFSYFYRRSFTFGELAILAQVITLLIHETLILNFIASPATPGKVLEHPQFLFLLTLVVGMLFIGVLLTPVLMYCRRLAQMPTKGANQASLQKREFKKKVSAGVVYTGLVAIVLGIIMPRTERILGQNPFLWLIEFMLQTKIFTADPPLGFNLESLLRIDVGWSRLGLCLYWVSAVGCSIAFFYWMNSSIRRRSIMGSLNNRRKYYHALAVLMFIPGYIADEPFMHIAFSVGLATLIFLEYIRYFAVVPFGKEIHLFLVGFLDERDGGPIILSHLYLLMGCAAPVWLAEHHILAGLSGIFALGVGDAMASIVGKRFGRHRWPGTIKTVEGTLAFVASVMAAAGAIFVGMWLMSFVFGSSTSSSSLFLNEPPTQGKSPYGLGGYSTASPTSPPAAVPSSVRPAALLSFSTWEDWSAVSWTVFGVIRYGLAVSIAAMLEAVSEQNDNLVIPVLMLAMVWLI
ncbi:hypothetical protein BGZ93_000636 [Podila epicladia]|nr:hypothetical protein BGZ93_000636 [Podila epicladia]